MDLTKLTERLHTYPFITARLIQQRLLGGVFLVHVVKDISPIFCQISEKKLILILYWFKEISLQEIRTNKNYSQTIEYDGKRKSETP